MELIKPVSPGFQASRNWAVSFMKRHRLSLRAKTSIAQRLPEDLETKSSSFSEFVEKHLIEDKYDDGFIISMDKTPVDFDLIPSKTMTLKGGAMKGESPGLRSHRGTRSTERVGMSPATRASSLTRSSVSPRGSLSPGTRESPRGTGNLRSPLRRIQRKRMQSEKDKDRGKDKSEQSTHAIDPVSSVVSSGRSSPSSLSVQSMPKSTPSLRNRLSTGDSVSSVGSSGRSSPGSLSGQSTPKSMPSIRNRLPTGDSVSSAGSSEQSSPGSLSGQSAPKSAPSIRTRLSTGSIHMNGTTTISSAKEKAEIDMIMKQIAKTETPLPAAKTAPPVGMKKRAAPSLTAPELASGEHPPPKKRKIGRNDGSGEDNRNDYFCWLCHKEGMVVCCELCPRVYHSRCLGLTGVLPNDWVCPECEKIMRAECIDTRSKAMEMLTLDQLCKLLRYALDRMKHAGSEPFQKAVDPSHVPNYSDYIFNPMDLCTLEKNIKKNQYGCTEALLADAKWILHNCIIYNGAHHKLTSSAKMIIKICKHEMNEIELCPDCYHNSCIRKNNEWFSEPCRVPHTLVWAKLKGYPFWPSKALREIDGQVDVRFFGAHDRSWVPVSQCFLLSKNIPTGLLKGKKNAGLDMAIEELEHHIQKIKENFGGFEYAPFRTPYDKTDSYKAISLKPISSKPVKSSSKSSSSFFFSTQKSGPNILKRSAVTKTASALKNKYTAMVSMKKIDSTPEKIKQKLEKFSDDSDIEMKESAGDDDTVDVKRIIETNVEMSVETKIKKADIKSDKIEITKNNETTNENNKKQGNVGEAKSNISETTPPKDSEEIKSEKSDKHSSENKQGTEIVKRSFVTSSIVERLAKKLALNDDKNNTENEITAEKEVAIKVSEERPSRASSTDKHPTNSDNITKEIKDKDCGISELKSDKVMNDSVELGKPRMGVDKSVSSETSNIEDYKDSKLTEKPEPEKSDEIKVSEERPSRASSTDKHPTNRDNITKEIKDKDCGISELKIDEVMDDSVELEKPRKGVDKSVSSETSHIKDYKDSKLTEKCEPEKSDENSHETLTNESEKGTNKPEIRTIDSYREKLESTISNCKAKLQMASSCSDDGGDDEGEEDEDASGNSSDGEEDGDENVDNATDDEEEEEEEEDDSGEDMNTEIDATDDQMEVDSEETIKTPDQLQSVVEDDSHEEVAAIEKIDNEKKNIPDNERIHKHEKQKEGDAENVEAKDGDNKLDENSSSNVDTVLELETDPNGDQMSTPNQTKILTLGDKDKVGNMEVDETKQNAKMDIVNTETKIDENKDGEKSDMAVDSDEKTLNSTDDNLEKTESANSKTVAEEKSHKFLGIKVSQMKESAIEKDIISNKLTQLKDNQNNSNKVESPAQQLKLKLSSVTGMLMEAENSEEDSDVDKLVIDLDAESDVNQTPPRFSMKGGSVKNGANFKKGVSPLVTSSEMYKSAVKVGDDASACAEIVKSVNKVSDAVKTGKTSDIAAKFNESVMKVNEKTANIVQDNGASSTDKSQEKSVEMSAVEEMPETQDPDGEVMEVDSQRTEQNLPTFLSDTPTNDSAAKHSTPNENTEMDVFEAPTSTKIAEKFSKKLLSTIQKTFDEMCAEVVREQTSEKNVDALQNQLEQSRWDYCTELTELKHNFHLTIAEMKSCWVTEKEKLSKSLKNKHAEEMEKIAKELKKKQWCAYCQKEAIFYCCWNTSYCDYPCQQNHWPQHMHSCLQTNKDKTAISNTASTGDSSQGQGQSRETPGPSVTGTSGDIGQSLQSTVPQVSTPHISPHNTSDAYRRIQENLSVAMHREEERRGESRAGMSGIGPKYGDSRPGVSPKYIPMSSPVNVLQNARQNTPVSMAMFSNMVSASQMTHAAATAGMMHQVPRGMFINQQIPMQSQRASLQNQSRHVNPRMVLAQPVIQQALYPVQLQQQAQHAGTLLFQNAQQQGMMGYGMRPPF